MPRFSNRPFLATTLSFLSSRGQPSGSAVRPSCAPLYRPTTSTNHHRISAQDAVLGYGTHQDQSRSPCPELVERGRLEPATVPDPRTTHSTTAPTSPSQ